MAEDVTQPNPPGDPPAIAAAEQPVEEQPAEAPLARPRPQTVLLGRFRLVYGVLALVVGAAVGSLFVLVGNPTSGGEAWSSWEPSGDPAQRMADIVQYVAPRYRTSDGENQLVAVTVSNPPTVQQVPVKWLALSLGGGNENISVMRADDTASFVLCGLGAACAIKSGEATVARGQLLRREALELALYTFKYVHGIDSVVALLPPRRGTTTRLAVFFEKDTLKPVLDQPLESTLPLRRRLTPTTLGTFETNAVQRYADRRTFAYSYQQAGDGSVFMALEPPQIENSNGQQGTTGTGTSP
jgi:hypothetical protein